MSESVACESLIDLNFSMKIPLLDRARSFDYENSVNYGEDRIRYSKEEIFFKFKVFRQYHCLNNPLNCTDFGGLQAFLLALRGKLLLEQVFQVVDLLPEEGLFLEPKRNAMKQRLR